MELDVQGRPTHVSTGGRAFDPTAPTVVLLHGAGMDHTVWQFQARAVAHHGYGVLAVDFPGHGRSAGPPPATIGGFADWLVALLDAAGVAGAHLVGHSMGSLVALDAAARHASRVRSIALLGVAERMPVHPELLAAAAADDHLAFELVTSWSHARAAHTGGHPTPGLWMMGATTRLLERSAPGVLHNDLAACDAYADAAASAAAASCPALLLLGEQDVMTRPAAAGPLAEALEDVRVVLVPGAGHMLMVEQPDATIDALLAFLADVLRGAPAPS